MQGGNKNSVTYMFSQGWTVYLTKQSFAVTQLRRKI